MASLPIVDQWMSELSNYIINKAGGELCGKVPCILLVRPTQIPWLPVLANMLLWLYIVGQPQTSCSVTSMPIQLVCACRCVQPPANTSCNSTDDAQYGQTQLLTTKWQGLSKPFFVSSRTTCSRQRTSCPELMDKSKHGNFCSICQFLGHFVSESILIYL